MLPEISNLLLYQYFNLFNPFIHLKNLFRYQFYFSIFLSFFSLNLFLNHSETHFIAVISYRYLIFFFFKLNYPNLFVIRCLNSFQYYLLLIILKETNLQLFSLTIIFTFFIFHRIMDPYFTLHKMFP